MHKIVAGSVLSSRSQCVRRSVDWYVTEIGMLIAHRKNGLYIVVQHTVELEIISLSCVYFDEALKPPLGIATMSSSSVCFT
jgi:hypothetical protein